MIIVGITGASGTIYGVQLVNTLRALKEEVHLVVSEAGRASMLAELGHNELALHTTQLHPNNAIGATIASGSHGHVQGMVIAPCSMNTLANIAHGLEPNLIARCAGVQLKERRPLILLTRESPLSLVHLRNMVSVTEAGAIVMPPVPHFYSHPTTITELVDQVVQHICDSLYVPVEISPRWGATHG